MPDFWLAAQLDAIERASKKWPRWMKTREELTMPEIDWKALEEALEAFKVARFYNEELVQNMARLKAYVAMPTVMAMPSIRALVKLAAKAPCERPQSCCDLGYHSEVQKNDPGQTHYFFPCGACDPCLAAALDKKLGG